jgi:carboxypeptidase PM20D1
VELSTEQTNKASAVSFTNNLTKNLTKNIGFKLIGSSIRCLNSNVLVTLYLVLAATDTRYFQSLLDNVHRFMMVSLNSTTLKQFHRT